MARCHRPGAHIARFSGMCETCAPGRSVGQQSWSLGACVSVWCVDRAVSNFFSWSVCSSDPGRLPLQYMQCSSRVDRQLKPDRNCEQETVQYADASQRTLSSLMPQELAPWWLSGLWEIIQWFLLLCHLHTHTHTRTIITIMIMPCSCSCTPLMYMLHAYGWVLSVSYSSHSQQEDSWDGCTHRQTHTCVINPPGLGQQVLTW